MKFSPDDFWGIKGFKIGDKVRVIKMKGEDSNEEVYVGQSGIIEREDDEYDYWVKFKFLESYPFYKEELEKI